MKKLADGDTGLQVVDKEVEVGSIWKEVEVGSIWKEVEVGSIWKEVEVGSIWKEVEVGSIWKEVEVESIWKEVEVEYRMIKNGKKFDWQTYDDRISQQPGRGTLVITKPRDEDLGYYQCFAYNDWGTAMSNSVHVRKAELSSFRDTPTKTVSANEGDPLGIKCSPPDGYPKPSVYWMKLDASGALISINSSRMTVDPEGTLWFSNVTREDSSKDFTYACSATSIFRSEYKVGNKVYLDVVSTGSAPGQSKHPPTQQYVSVRNFVVLRGEKAELWCIYGGTPLPEITWRKRGAPIQSSYGKSYQTTNYGKTLQFKYVDFDDQGTYDCTATNGVGAAQTHSIRLVVESRPYFTREPEIVMAAEDETAEFFCEANGLPKPNIEWFHNGKPIRQSPYNPRRQISAGKITIRNLEKSDTGNYACNASNSLGYVFKDVFVNVLALPPDITNPPSDARTVSGETVTLSCRTFGAPKPLVKWVKGTGQELTGGRFNITGEGDLVISNVIFTDAGEYTCHASNKFGHANASGSLVVKEQTRITRGPEDYEVAAGTTATFRCTANSDPSLPLTIDWLKNGQRIDFEQEPRFIQSADYSLTITKTTELDSGSYTCLAKTDLDEDTAPATLTVQDVPNPPLLRRVVCSEKQAMIEWSPQGDNRAPILNYVIQYNTTFTPDTWEDAFSDVPAAENTFEVSLSPYTNYTFRVISRNKIGPSPPSLPSREVCTTKPDVPFKNPGNVRGRGTSPSNMVISWARMEQIEHNGPRFKYVVHWRRDLPDRNWNTHEVTDWRQTQHLVGGLPTYQRYAIMVVAHNAMGESNVAPREYRGFSGEDMPLEAPRNFTVRRVVDAQTAVLSWEPVTPGSVRGEFKGYKIQTWTEEDPSVRDIIVAPDAVETVLNKFIPYSRNFAHVLVFNGAYNGPPSNEVSFRTPVGLPGPIDYMEAYAMGSSALYVMWKRPRQPNGPLTGYRIYYQKLTGTSLGPKMERVPAITDYKMTRAKLAGLEPGTKYRITVTALRTLPGEILFTVRSFLRVQATTTAGEGKPYFIERSTNPAGEAQPETPNFTWEHVHQDEGLAAVRIRWLPNMQGTPGSHFYVQYRKRGETLYQRTEDELYEDFKVVDSLQPGEVYEFRVVAVDGTAFAYSLPEEIHAWSEDGSLYLSSDNIAHAGWFVGMMVAICLLLLVLVLVCVIKRNRGGKYNVYDQELSRGKPMDYPEETGFHEYSRPPDEKSAMTFPPPRTESDTDSFGEVEGGGETGG
ncbi:unnamed protein product, partial [Cyprideis torosa]